MTSRTKWEEIVFVFASGPVAHRVGEIEAVDALAVQPTIAQRTACGMVVATWSGAGPVERKAWPIPWAYLNPAVVRRCERCFRRQGRAN